MYGCNIIGVWEKPTTDITNSKMQGAADIGKEIARAAPDLKWVFADVEFMECHRREPHQSTSSGLRASSGRRQA